MIIRDMTATFGRLNGEMLRLKDGLNIIKAPNESGKSTWCAFIRAMLYGVDSSERAKGSFLPDKTRYSPWSGALMAGTMTLEHGGREITLRRSSKSAASPMREFSAVYAGTENAVPGLTGAEAGEALTGVSREVFRRSAFIEQGAIAVAGSAELERRIASVVSSGEEGTSFSEADELLRAWQRRRKYNRRGAIPELEAQIAQSEETLRRLDELEAEKLALSDELESCTAEISKLKSASREARERARRENSNALIIARQREINCEAAKNAAAQKATALRTELLGDVFGSMTPDEAAQRAGEDFERAESFSAETKKSFSSFYFLFVALLCLTSLGMGIVAAWPFFIAVVVFGVAALLLYRRGMAVVRSVAAARTGLEEILKKYSVSEPAGIYAAADGHSALYEACEAAQKAAGKAGAELHAARAALEREQSRIVANELSEGERDIIRRLDVQRARSANLENRLAELSGAAETTGDPMAIASSVIELKSRLDELEGQYAALALADDVLREADAEIQSRFSPALGRLAAQYMSRMTGGRYTELSLARDFSATARTEGDAVARGSAYLSAGTVDLLYLAVRLAVCELALPGEDTCPLVLDDALVNLDSERERSAMELLEEISQKRQIILFTCK